MRVWLGFGQGLLVFLLRPATSRIKPVVCRCAFVLAVAPGAFGAAAAEPSQSQPLPAASAPDSSPAPAAAAAPGIQQEQDPDDTKSAEGWFKNPNAVRSAPRRVTLPGLDVTEAALLQTTEVSAAKTGEWPRGKPYNYRAARFSVVLAMASWSARSEDVARRLHGWGSEFAKRKIALVGVFSHDAPSDIRAVMTRNQFTFPAAKASLTFVSQLLNPKVPTIWVADHTGQIVLRLERPTDGQLQDLRQKILEWTDF